MKIAVLIGGASPEREVSYESGKAVYNAMVELGHDVKVIDPAYGADQYKNAEDYFIDKDEKKLCAGNYVTCIESGLLDDSEFVFNALHGEWGEDGRIQALLDLKGINYSGAGVLASSVAMDKNVSKIMFRHFDVSTANWTMYENGDDLGALYNKVEKVIKFPCIIKPNNGGSTIGLSLCEKEEEVESALVLALKYSKSVMIEQFIEGREIAVGILNGAPLPVLEIKPKKRLYDYECKYTDGMSEYEVPAKLSEEVTEKLQHEAQKAYYAVGCKTYGRIDFRLDSDNRPYCLEVNTLPGLTTHSLLPKMAYAAGKSFNDMISTIIRNSIK